MLRTGWTKGAIDPEDILEDLTTSWESAKEGDIDGYRRASAGGVKQSVLKMLENSRTLGVDVSHPKTV